MRRSWDARSLAALARVIVFRVGYKRFAVNPLSGEGSFLYSGRWSSVGTRVAYTASTASLAIMEFRAHLDFEDFDPDAPPDLVIVSARFPDHAMLTLDQLGLRQPVDWSDVPAPAADAAIGDGWFASAESLALAVPSVLLPPISPEMNLLINPLHPQFQDVEIRVDPFEYDRRLLQGRSR